MFSFVTYFRRYVPVVKNIRIEKTIALVIRTYFDVTKIAIQRIAKHLNYMCVHYNLSPLTEVTLVFFFLMDWFFHFIVS